MSRWLAGIFDPGGHSHQNRLAKALAPHSATLLIDGALQLAYSGRASESRDPLCLLDGHLDNAAELRRGLDVSDDMPNEQILAIGWHRWGVELLARMRGDFALLIWDRERSEGLLARDQLGVRSIFLHDSSDGLRFACEIRHLLALSPRRPAPDTASVAHWLAMSNRPGSATLYAGIRRLDPGTMLLLDASGVRERQYWAPRFREPLGEEEPELAHRIYEGFDLAVHRRIDIGAPTGVLMSGGLDSASVAAVASRHDPGRIHAYSGLFPEHPAVDESMLIEELRVALQLPGINAEVQPGGLLASAVEAARSWEMPLLGWGDFWTLPLLRAAAGSGVRIMLGGDGGDELFGVRAYLIADRLRAGHPLRATALARELPGAGDHPGRRRVAEMAVSLGLLGAVPYRVHETLRRSTAARGVPSWMLPKTAHALLDSDDPLAWKRFDGPLWWANAAHGLTRGVEETGIFEHQRRRAADAGLEARHPFFDLDLLDLCLRQPPRATFDRYRNRPVLRAAMAGLLPDAVRLRPGKASFNSLLVDAMIGQDGPAIRQLLTDPGAELHAYVDPRAIERTLFETDRHRREQPFRWMWQIWRLMTAECWLRTQAIPSEPARQGLAASEPSIAIRPASDTRRRDPDISYVFPP